MPEEEATTDEHESNLDEVHVEGDDLVKKLRIENKRLTKQVKSFQQREYDLNQRLGKLEHAKETEAEAKEREAGEFAKIEARMKQQIEDLQNKFSSAHGELEGLRKEKREETFLDRLSSQTGIKNRHLLRGQLREAAAQAGFETAPENLTDAIVEEAAKTIRDQAPELFNASSGGSPGGGGHNETTKPDGEKSTSDGESKGARLGRAATAAFRRPQAQ